MDLLRRGLYGRVGESEPDLVESLRVSDVSARVHFTAFPEIHVVSSMPMSEKEAAIAATPLDASGPQTCHTENQGGDGAAVVAVPEPETLLGYQVVKRTYSSEGPTGTMHLLESWVAPALNCYQLREVVTLNGSVTKRTTVVSFTTGEPESTHFEFPGEYQESQPSDAINALTEQRGLAPRDSSAPPLGQAKQRYHERRSTAGR